MNVRVVREAGGIGDIVRIIPVLRGLREKYPGARLWVFAPAAYRPLLRGWYDEFRGTPQAKRRPRDSPLDEKRWPYLDVGVRFDVSVSLYCPAFRHEHGQRGNVWLDRIDLFCRAADVRPGTKTPRVNLNLDDVRAAREYVERNGLRNRNHLIAIQPFSTDPARNWPLVNWQCLAHALEWVGHRVIVLDGARGRTNGFPQHRVLGRPLGFIAALLSRCDLLVGPDSGLGHLAAAVGTPAVGVFASQSGPVMYRHYPLHTYVYPPWDGQAHCKWPCFWNRPPGCSRQALVKAGKTCAMLARISVEDVYDAVTAHLRRVEQPLAEPVSVPAMSAEARAGLGDIEEIKELPIPHRDFALDRLALTRAVEDIRPVLREAYRVLRPGGKLHLPEATVGDVRPLLSGGFQPDTDACSPAVATWAKLGTGPVPTAAIASNVSATATHASSHTNRHRRCV